VSASARPDRDRLAPHVCPNCGGAILWCDGQPAPELLFSLVGGPHGLRDARLEVIACTRCMPKRLAPSDPRRAAPLPPPPGAQENLAAWKKRMAAEAGAVVGLLNEGAEHGAKAH